ncbi:Mfa1 fimbrilin C-terminal domain-containing protein [Dysgonomonas sp. GY75]|uniref:Mfa1 family fimbria major subunit n=2 Tax=Dysgonomonas sp. GY75 TaxID=2780419 RepID=UPI0018846590|nr:Mfa1 family fimbria major subunit [Dysgonomonas sp. GY75]MBF0647964.1 Mfa1 fimbrilin C-terminal domain-containing protein [Dysgonomonas sp. GY75]
MKRKLCSFLTGLILLTGFTACSTDEGTGKEGTVPGGTTHMGLMLSLVQNRSVKAADDPDYNAAGQYSGVTEIVTLDLYLLSSDGATLLDARRFGTSDFLFGANPDGSDAIKLTTPFKTIPGDKQMVVILNSPEPLLTAIPGNDYLYTLSSTLPLSSLARIDQSSSVTTPEGLTIYADLLTLSGKSNTFSIQDGISAEDVTASGKNMIALNVTRIPSRAIVTTSAPADVVNTDGVKLGTISNITYSVAQGAKAVYLFPQTNADGSTKTWGSDYLPGVGVDYTSTAAAYYDYTDLQNLTDAVPAKPSDGSHITFPGKFLLENTHQRGTDASNSQYRKGNTAYILVRATFTPDPSQIRDGGALTGGTFYVGDADGHIYSSIQKAQDYTTGVQNQPVSTYTGGKVLYYIWLNPDNIAKPVNSPVIRNNIYHVNINSFKRIGVNWNPLIPSGPDVPYNPDPKPSGPEPENPVDPNGPLSSDDTYMSVDIKVLMWTVHTYDIDL